ncbi:MAG: DUF3182 family protein [Cellvibrio sp.]|jgi:hypothetical protein
MHSLAEVTHGKQRVCLLPMRSTIPEHELQSLQRLTEHIAALLGLPTGEIADARSDMLYVIPSDTLIGTAEKQRFGLSTVDDFFGGWVSEPFMSTKAITHPLFDDDSQMPAGWSQEFSTATSRAVLHGFTAFSIKDAYHAAQHLLQRGPLRLKCVRANAGRGQFRIKDQEQLTQVLARIDEAEIGVWGLVLEEDLQQVMTLSVGQSEVAGVLISYVGTQQLTRNNWGEQVYGGSRLTTVRGGYAELLRLKLSERVRMAIAQARLYEVTAHQCFGLLASRRNYDVAQGFTAAGDFRSGVLEQSWRIGGASGAEVLALEKFLSDETVSAVRASTREVYGACQPPEQACILYRGEDAEVGPITKYAELSIYDDTN